MKRSLKKILIIFISILLISTMSFSLFSCGKLKHKGEIKQITAKWDGTEKKSSKSVVTTNIEAKMGESDKFFIGIKMETNRKFTDNRKVEIESKISFSDIKVQGLFSSMFSQLNLTEKGYLTIVNGNEDAEYFKEGLQIKFVDTLAVQDLQKISIKMVFTIPDVNEKNYRITSVDLNLASLYGKILVKSGTQFTDLELERFIENKVKPRIKNGIDISEGTPNYLQLDQFGIISANINDYEKMSGYDIDELDEDIDKKNGALESVKGRNIKYTAKSSKKYVEKPLLRVNKILTNQYTKSVLNKTLEKFGLNVDTILQLMNGEKTSIQGLSYEWGPQITFDFILDKELPRKMDIKNAPKVESLKSIQNGTKITIDKQKIIDTAQSSIDNDGNLTDEMKARVKEILNEFSDMKIKIDSVTYEEYEY